MPIPQLTPEQRSQALAKAAEARRQRAHAKEQLKAGGVSVGQVLADADADEVLARLRVVDLLASLPGVGPVTAHQVMTELGIAPSRRVGGLGAHQRSAILARFDR